jgi:hypothetical protein
MALWNETRMVPPNNEPEDNSRYSLLRYLCSECGHVFTAAHLLEIITDSHNPEIHKNPECVNKKGNNLNKYTLVNDTEYDLRPRVPVKQYKIGVVY